MPSSDTAEKPKRGPRRWLRRLAVLALVVGVVLWSGWPQRFFARTVIERALGAQVVVGEMTTWGEVVIDAILIYAPDAQQGGDEPVISLQGIRADYTLNPPDGRYLSSLSVDSVRLYLDARDTAEPNYAFLIPGDSEPREALDGTFVPRGIEVGAIMIELLAPGAEAHVDGISARADVQTLEDFRASIDAKNLRATFSGDALEGMGETAKGQFSLATRYEGDTLETRFRAAIPGIIEGSGTSTSSPDGYQIAVPSANVDGARINPFLAAMSPVPVRFSEIDVARLLVSSTADASAPRIDVKAQAADVQLGSGDHVLFAGGLGVDAWMGGEDANAGMLTLQFDLGHTAQALFSVGEEESAVQFTFQHWTHAQAMSLVPSDVASFAEGLSFDELQGRCEVTLRDEQVHVEIATSPMNADAPSITVTAEFADTPWFLADANVRLASGSVDTSLRAASPDVFEWTTRVESLAATDAFRLLMSAAPPEDLSGAVSGEIVIAREAGEDFIAINPALTISRPAYTTLAYEELILGGGIRLNAALTEFSGAALTVEAADGVSTGRLSELRGTVSPFVVEAKLDGTLALEPLGIWLEQPDLWGEMMVAGTLRFAESVLTMPWTFESDYLGLGDLSVPYGAKLEGGGTLYHDAATSVGRVEGLEGTIGDGTQFGAGAVIYALEPFDVVAPVWLRSDLAVVVDMALLESAEGRASLDAEAHVGDDGLLAQWELNVDVERASLPEEVGSVVGLNLTGSGSYDGEMDGTGMLRIDAVHAAGGQLSHLSGATEFMGDAIRVPDARGTLFGGRFVADMSAHVLDTAQALKLSGRADGIDLAKFTEEVQPPDVTLTGIADGVFDIRYDVDGLQELTFYVYSEENFSLNRSAVENVLQSESFQGAFVSGKVDKIVSKFLGEAPQRPFDTAEMQMRQQGKRLHGMAILNSVKTDAYNGLDLTVDLAIDISALAQAVSILEEESKVENVEF